MAKNNSSIPLYDINLSAYLLFKGTVPELKAEGKRVVFLFPNKTETFQLMKQYNENPLVPVIDFITCLRRLRSQMLALRDRNLTGGIGYAKEH
ncbi:MAG: DUF5659 domain-containing protein [Syntrophales bacterium]|jgi:hypothetical protein